MPYQVSRGDEATISGSAFGWSQDHYNGKPVDVLESGSGSQVVSVRCQCCGDVVDVSVDELE